jgi:mRNA-degrading endonuclease YafQ of YafQ-DinJ toxin-antitoxin module
MKIELTERFQRDVRALPQDRKSAVLQAVLSLLRAIGEPHLHAGLGIRKLHHSGIWEARVGLGLRLVFIIQTNLLSLLRVGTHEEIRRYLREL